MPAASPSTLPAGDDPPASTSPSASAGGDEVPAAEVTATEASAPFGGPSAPAGGDPALDPDELPLDMEEWLSWLATEKGRARSTLAAYRRDARRWWRWLQAHGVDLAEVGEGDIGAYVGELRSGDLAPATVARAVVSVRSLHRFLADEGRAPADPGAHVETPRVPAGLPKALSEDEVAALLGAVVGDEPVARRDRAILEVLYGTGLRISELVGLRLGDLDLESALLRALGKGSKERVVPVGRHAVAALADWLGPSGRPRLEPERWARRGDADAVFLNRRGGRLTRQGAWLVVTRWGAEVGLEGKLTPHVLRHSCATHMLDHGADIRAVQEMLGHASVSTTQVYTKVSTERLFAAYRAAHPRATISHDSRPPRDDHHQG
ncbi:MAG TPA: site-specific tyrosine recombinase [Acidimicrobiales bacterium]|nr:site-specific tyrosine recombinase [Acidimicrobiales bacterium]